MAVRIITDSAADVPESIQQQYNLEVIPTPVVIEGKDYFDGTTVKPSQFYQILRDGKDVKTYHINSYMFRTYFEPYAKRGDELIYICFSTGIAGTFNAANLCKEELKEEYPEFELTIIDSKGASLGFGLVVYYALKMLENHVEKQTIIEAIVYHCQHMNTVFTVDTLEYLYKGGRLSKSAALAGGILDIKPIIEVNENGSLEAIEKVRGRHRSLRRLTDLIGEKTTEFEHQYIGIVHGDCYEELLQVKEMLKNKYGCDKFIESEVGCAIGAHTGPGIIGIVCMDKTSPYYKYII